MTKSSAVSILHRSWLLWGRLSLGFIWRTCCQPPPKRKSYNPWHNSWCLHTKGLITAPEKVHRSDTAQYLGPPVNRTVKPQKHSLDKTSKNNDFQKPLWDSNQLCNTTGIPNYALNNLFKMSQGEMTLDSAHILRSKRRTDSRLKNICVGCGTFTAFKHTFPTEVFAPGIYTRGQTSGMESFTPQGP